MGMGEDADLGIGEDQPSHQIILQVTLDGPAERLFSETAPCLSNDCVALKLLRHLVFRNERLQHAAPNLLSKHAGEIVEFFQLLVFRLVTGELEHRSKI